MAISIQHKTTLKDFEDFIYHPDNIDRHFEFIGGEIVEMVSNNYSSEVAAEIIFLIRLHMREAGIQGHVTAPDGGYVIGEDRYIPDVSFISSERQPNSSREAYNTNTPNLVVEVMSPTDTDKAMRIKVANYLAYKVVVWVVRPDDKIVEVYEHGKPVTLLSEGDTLHGGQALPKFNVAVKDLFPPQYEDSEES